jgi:hypothetical protein
MKGHLLAALLVNALALPLTARAGPAAKGPAKETRLLTALVKQRQEDLRAQFWVFREKLIRLVRRLEDSERPEDRKQATFLWKLLAQCDEGRLVEDNGRLIRRPGIGASFDVLLRELSSPDAFGDLKKLRRVVAGSRELRADLLWLINTLEDGPRDDQGAREKTAQLLDQLKELIAGQERVRALTRTGRKPDHVLVAEQNELTRKTRAVLVPKKAQGKGREKGSKGGDGQPDDNPVKQQIEDANQHQKQAEGKIKAGKLDDASEEQGKAIDNLRGGRKKLGGLLAQMREEEAARALADLERRCRSMLALQTEVRRGTVALGALVQANPGKKPTLANRARSNQLADIERKIIEEAEFARRRLKRVGFSVAFAEDFQEVFQQVTVDMDKVCGRLNKADTGKVTVTIENDVIETFNEMIEVLKKAQKDNKSKPGKPGPKPTGETTDLIRLLVRIEAELDHLEGALGATLKRRILQYLLK